MPSNDRPEPTFHRVTLPDFDEPLGAAAATLAFEANYTEDAGPDSGTVVEAGRQGTWVLTLTLKQALPAESRIAFRKVENEFRFDYIHQDYWPNARGYVTVEAGDGTALPFVCDTAMKSAIPAVVALPRDFAAGESLVLRIGDQRSGGDGVAVRTATYDQAHIEVGLALPGESVWHAVPSATVTARVVPVPAVRRTFLWAPSTVGPSIRMNVVALSVDINNNPVGDGVRTPAGMEIRGAEDATEAVREVGSALHASLSSGDPGVTRLQLNDSVHGVSSQSNPILVQDERLNVYWGEFHCHGYDAVELNVLNETTHPDKAYRYGRDVTRLDFMAMGSHIFRDSPDAVHEWWELYREAAARYDAPGEYVTLLGCEWRDRIPDGGDRNLIWRELDAPAPDPGWRIDEVYRHMAEQNGMVTPHVGGAIALPYHHNSEVEWLCELTSGHGNFEWFAQSYLQKGYRVGLIGGSDGHKGTPGHPRVVSQSGGRFANILRRRDAGWAGGPILGVLAEALTRESLWAAFQARRVYATTGARALVDFRINDTMMGGALAADGDVEIAVEIHAAAPIESVTLIRGDRRRACWTFEPPPLDVAKTMTDTPPAGETYYYLRVEQVDGEIIWSSPIWVTSHNGGEGDKLPAWNHPVELDLHAIEDPAAARHLPDLLRYLRTEEKFEAFSDITPYKVVASPMGHYAVFLCHLRGRRARIHWFYEFELPRLRMETGWVHYGREQIMYQPWATPLYPDQVRL